MNRMNKKAGLLLTLLLTMAMVMSTSVLGVYAGGDEPEYSYPTVYIADSHSPDGFAIVPEDGSSILGGTVYFEDGYLVLDNFRYTGDGLVAYPSVDTNSTRGAIWIKGYCDIKLKGKNSIVINAVSEDKAQLGAVGIYAMPAGAKGSTLNINGDSSSSTRQLDISVKSTSPNENVIGIFGDGPLNFFLCTVNASTVGTTESNDTAGIASEEDITIDRARVTAKAGNASKIGGSSSNGMYAFNSITVTDHRSTSLVAESGLAYNSYGIECNTLVIENPITVTALAGRCYEEGSSVGLRANKLNIDVDTLEENDTSYCYTFKSNDEDGVASSAYPNPAGNLGYYMDIDDVFSGPTDTSQRIDMSKTLILNGAKSVVISDINNAKKIADMNFNGINAAYEDPDGNPVVPVFKVFDGDKELTEGTDYIATYSGTTVKETDKGSVTVYGLGKYYGQMTAQYEVYAKQNISNCVYSPATDEYSYSGSSLNPNHVFLDGTYKLEYGSDYNYRFYSDPARTIEVDPVDAGEYYVTVYGINAYKGEIDLGEVFTINKAVPAITLSKSSFTYNGKTQKPTATSNSDGTISIPAGKKPGTYTVSITEGTNYKAGTAKYTIKVKPTTISKLSKGKKSFTVTAKKQSSTYITGYQVRYSTKSSMASSKTVTIGTKTTAYKKTVKKLKAKKKYYVQVRTYKKIGTKKYYSAWSDKKAVTTK